METTSVVRSRPANRRELIIEAAATAFAARGYENVAMSAVAEAVGVRPSALYRHFANKEAMLAAAFEGYVLDLREALAAGSEGDRFGPLIDRTLAHRAAGRLWIREARYLSADSVAVVREGLLADLDAVVAAPGDGAGARVRSIAVLGVLLSTAMHATESAVPPMRALLSALVSRAAAGPLAADGALVVAPRGLPRIAKREQILAAAVELFAARTYDGVALDDIAAAVDLAPSSIYNHFASKEEILASALHRANGFVQVDLDEVLAATDDPGVALHAIVERYAGFAVRHPGMTQAIVSEIGELTERESAVLIDAQRAYVGEWVHLYGSVDQADSSARRVAVMAAITAVNQLACTPGAPRGAERAALVTAYGRRILGVDGARAPLPRA
ncbi:TetR/AcrR family transcriptional regulator [Tsukamurella tyrosinosolvens]|uniref:TetR/AcrR family transcriptional regulator n=1 Tax=Tsukamurella tyrosinosolvens TaxID=57704 RepID=UPI001AF73FAC|nr:TetR/AcrR family transcriptional regulator [Tsukamurella tyrosinosolvens]QRY85675.1 TetR/AcrR family transcriptional regulator [Tsukamurella tyrosinosolvens]